jgi:hypothetical protein
MTHSTTATVGWDIGGVNTKAALVELDAARAAPAAAVAWLLAESLVKT